MSGSIETARRPLTPSHLDGVCPCCRYDFFGLVVGVCFLPLCISSFHGIVNKTYLVNTWVLIVPWLWNVLNCIIWLPMSFQTKTRKTSPSRMSPHSLHTVSQPGSQCHPFSSKFIFCEVTLVISKLLFPVSICWTACLSLENKRTLFPGDRSHKKWHAVSSFQRKFLQNKIWTEVHQDLSMRGILNSLKLE